MSGNWYSVAYVKFALCIAQFVLGNRDIKRSKCFQKYNSASLKRTTFSTFVCLIFAVSAVVGSSPEAYPYMPA